MDIPKNRNILFKLDNKEELNILLNYLNNNFKYYIAFNIDDINFIKQKSYWIYLDLDLDSLNSIYDYFLQYDYFIDLDNPKKRYKKFNYLFCTTIIKWI